jgi:hypothetical protein
MPWSRRRMGKEKADPSRMIRVWLILFYFSMWFDVETFGQKLETLKRAEKRKRKSNGMPERWIEGQNYKLSISGVSFVAEETRLEKWYVPVSMFPFNAEIIIKFKSKPREVPPTTRDLPWPLSLVVVFNGRWIKISFCVVIVKSFHCLNTLWWR